MTAYPLSWLYLAAGRMIPPVRTGTVSEWCAENLRDPGSARSEKFDPTITPWIIEPLNCADDGVTRRCTFVKPVQAGGSKVGEGAICYWIDHAPGGDIGYYWPNGEKAKDRWEKRIERLLRSTKCIAQKMAELEATERGRFKVTKGRVLFPHLTLAMLAAYNQSDVESDSYRFVVNEEVHDNHNNKGWLPGRLKQAEGRTTAYWNSFIYDISNAGEKGDQLNQAYESGTQQQWEVMCPGCGQYQSMFSRVEKGKPGGLRYDSEGCRIAGRTGSHDGGYDYNKLSASIRYEFPCCGFIVRDSAAERRALSFTGRYSKPTNSGATGAHRSFRLEAVSIDYIPWLTLIQEKHEALRAMRYGDPEPWKRYLQERECRFWNPEERPLVGKVVLSSNLKKNRDGLEGRHARFFALDRQQGSLAKGELPHWWLVIRDAMPTGDSALVWEGKLLTDEDVISVLDDHKCIRRHGVADSGDDTTAVYQFCLRYGINAIKGSPQDFFAHRVFDANGQEITVQKIYSPEKPLHAMIGAPPSRESDIDEPMFWHYSKKGIADRLHWLRAGGAVKWDVPSDVSEDYQKHMEAEEQETIIHAKDGRRETIWRQHSERNDLLVCERYIGMLFEMAGLIGAQNAQT